MSKHTPGPWWIDWNVSRLDIFSSDAATLVATLRRSALSEGIDETARANARLIALSPTMFDALSQWAWAEAHGDSAEMENARKARDAAIAKARGEK